MLSMEPKPSADFQASGNAFFLAQAKAYIISMEAFGDNPRVATIFTLTRKQP